MELGSTSPRFKPHSFCPQTHMCARNTTGIFTETPYSLRFKHTYLRVLFILRLFFNRIKLSVTCSAGRTARAIIAPGACSCPGASCRLGAGRWAAEASPALPLRDQGYVTRQEWPGQPACGCSGGRALPCPPQPAMTGGCREPERRQREPADGRPGGEPGGPQTPTVHSA